MRVCVYVCVCVSVSVLACVYVGDGTHRYYKSECVHTLLSHVSVFSRLNIVNLQIL